MYCVEVAAELLADVRGANCPLCPSGSVAKARKSQGYLVIITASYQKLKNPFPDRPDYQPNRHQKGHMRQLINFVSLDLDQGPATRKGERDLCLSGRSGGQLLGGAEPGRLSG